MREISHSYLLDNFVVEGGRMSRFWLYLFFLFLIFNLSGCGSRSLEDFQEEGEGVVRSLIQEFKSIHTRQDLIRSSMVLQKLFDRLVTVMIAAEEFSLSKCEKGDEFDLEINYELNDQLRIELSRLYRLEGGRQIIEKSQEKALYRLDAFEKKRARQLVRHVN